MTKTLPCKEAIPLWREGKDAWNAWAIKPENKDCRVSFENYNFRPVAGKDYVTFEGFIFPASVSFRAATFNKVEVNFMDIQVGDGCFNFMNTQFGDGDVHFVNAKFGVGLVDFRNAKFGEGRVNFIDVQFGDGDVHFRGIEFGGGVVDFRDARFGKGYISFSDTSVDTFYFTPANELQFAPNFQTLYIRKTAVIDALRIAPLKNFTHGMAERYRALKKMAAQSHNHTQEIEFFAEETRATHYHEGEWKSPLIYLYDSVSNFGRNIYRPGALLFSFWVYFAYAYLIPPGANVNFPAAFSLSASNTFAFLSWARTGREEALKALYGNSWSGWVDAISYTQGVLSLLLLFLIGLAIRNKLRL